MPHIGTDNWIFCTHGMDEVQPKNTEFYSACTEYFTALRKQGKKDDGFEDEFYYTMPVISGSN